MLLCTRLPRATGTRVDVLHLHIRKPPATNLPLQVTSFIGWERELAKGKRLLATTRFLTLTGPEVAAARHGLRSRPRPIS